MPKKLDKYEKENQKLAKDILEYALDSAADGNWPAFDAAYGEMLKLDREIPGLPIFDAAFAKLNRCLKKAPRAYRRGVR